MDRFHHCHINFDHYSMHSILHATQATAGTMSSIFKILPSRVFIYHRCFSSPRGVDVADFVSRMAHVDCLLFETKAEA